MPRDVTVDVHYEVDRSRRVIVHGPAGPVDVGRARISAEVGRVASEGVRAVFGAESVSFALRVGRPPWLREGMIVRLDPREVDPDEGVTHPYAQIVGFLPIGGVTVFHPEVSSGVYAPEFLTPVDPSQLSASVVESIAGQTGLNPDSAHS